LFLPQGIKPSAQILKVFFCPRYSLESAVERVTIHAYHLLRRAARGGAYTFGGGKGSRAGGSNSFGGPACEPPSSRTYRPCRFDHPKNKEHYPRKSGQNPKNVKYPPGNPIAHGCICLCGIGMFPYSALMKC
jgi:hypothetical protein